MINISIFHLATWVTGLTLSALLSVNAHAADNDNAFAMKQVFVLFGITQGQSEEKNYKNDQGCNFSVRYIAAGQPSMNPYELTRPYEFIEFNFYLKSITSARRVNFSDSTENSLNRKVSVNSMDLYNRNLELEVTYPTLKPQKSSLKIEHVSKSMNHISMITMESGGPNKFSESCENLNLQNN